MSWYKQAAKFGYCLQKALELIDLHPELKLMMGPPDRKEDTAHFWVVNEYGQVIDPASDAVGDDYEYKGREINLESIKDELV